MCPHLAFRQFAFTGSGNGSLPLLYELFVNMFLELLSEILCNMWATPEVK